MESSRRSLLALTKGNQSRFSLRCDRTLRRNRQKKDLRIFVSGSFCAERLITFGCACALRVWVYTILCVIIAETWAFWLYTLMFVSL